MQQRIDYTQTAPDLYRKMLQLEQYVRSSRLEPSLLELIKIRASQLNGCAFCIDMHTREAREAGETEQRLYCVSVWREAPFYTEAERAALELTEVLTQLTTHRVSDELFARLRLHWEDRDICDLIGGIVAINGWNRLSVAMGNVPEPRA